MLVLCVFKQFFISGENEISLLVKWNLETIQKSAELDTRKWNGHPFEIGWPVHSIRDCRLRIGVCLCVWVGVCDSSGFFVVLYRCKEETFKKKRIDTISTIIFLHMSRSITFECSERYFSHLLPSHTLYFHFVATLFVHWEEWNLFKLTYRPTFAWANHFFIFWILTLFDLLTKHVIRLLHFYLFFFYTSLNVSIL